METAIIGLVGVALGVLLGILKDWLLHEAKRKKDYEYLAIRVACELDRFVYRCVDIVHDDGTYLGQYDKDGQARIQVQAPEFNPLDLDVDWKSLPSNLAYEILNLPIKIEIADDAISRIRDAVAMPPFYDEMFEARHLNYCDLGLQALELAKRLRAYAKISPIEHSEVRGPKEIFQDKRRQVIEIQEKRYAAQRELLSLVAENGE